VELAARAFAKISRILSSVSSAISPWFEKGRSRTTGRDAIFGLTDATTGAVFAMGGFFLQASAKVTSF